MAKESRCLRFITVFVTMLLVSSIYASQTPNVRAVEATSKEKGLSILGNVIGLNQTGLNQTDSGSDLKYPEPCADISKVAPTSSPSEVVYASRYESDDYTTHEHYGTKLYASLWTGTKIWGVYAAHEVDEDIVIDVDAVIYAPTTKAPNYGPLELGTKYEKDHTPAFYVYNLVDNSWAYKTINSDFLNDYARIFDGKQMYFVESIWMGDAWYALLYNFTKGQWENATQTEPGNCSELYKHGWSYWETYTYTWPLDPMSALSRLEGDYIQVYDGTNWHNVTGTYGELINDLKPATINNYYYGHINEWYHWYFGPNRFYEHYNTGDDDWGGNQGGAAIWQAQTFTAAVTGHTVSSVKIKAYRVGSPGTFTLSIRATSSGLPTGGDLTSGSVNANSWSTQATWISIPVTQFTLSASTKYAIVCRSSVGDANNYFCWQCDTTSPTYTGGNRAYSLNSGGSWSADNAQDFMFEVWSGSDKQCYEFYDTGDDDWGGNRGSAACWQAQTFSVGSTAHVVTSVKLKLFKAGNPGTFTVSIRATDANGLPTGSDLTSGSVAGSGLPTSASWFGIAVTQYSLSANTKYAIVCRSSTGDASNYFAWRCDTSSPSYTGGNRAYSTNNGSTWSNDMNQDFMFEVWG
jgi:hypothetical protein